MEISSTPEIKLRLEFFLDLALLAALNGRHQVAVWKKPKEQDIHILIDKTDRIKRVPLEIEDLTSGFILHPFADQEDKKAYYLEASEHIKLDLSLAGFSVDQLPAELKLDVESTEAKSIIRKYLFNHLPSKTLSDQPASTTKADFMDQVIKGIDAIKSGNLTKIVPVKRKIVRIGEGFDITRAFISLCQAYPNAFVNFFHIPSLGSWIGASPEILIKTRGDQFSTMALAGSQMAVGDNPLKNVAWTQKEIEEQALVSRYIVGCFKKIRLREYEEIGPKTDIAGNLLHLRTDFKVDMKATNFPLLGSAMLGLLHPTSAVAGMPRDKALEFIQQHEDFDRSLFSGYLGPVNIEGETALFVNLRCATLLGRQAILYAGAGVTEDSDPEKEWEETELKCDIIGKFIQEDE
jgi:isochorismate synthase